MDTNWMKHHLAVKEKHPVPSYSLIKALESFDKERHTLYDAVDLGCGAGTDSLALLEKGWQVMALDKNTSAVKQLKNSLPSDQKHRLMIISCCLEQVFLPCVLLVNASFSLPFCAPESFDALWDQITGTIRPGGRFAGHFFGIRDSWSSNRKMTFHSEKQVLHLFNGFELEYFQETDKKGKTLAGEEKHWHVFHAVAKKNDMFPNAT